jgi:hypothetical protein
MVNIQKYIDYAKETVSTAVTGDCGMFAFALGKLLNNDCLIGLCVKGINLSRQPSLTAFDQKIEQIDHVVIKYHNKLYDVEGETDIDKIQHDYFEDGIGTVVFYTVSTNTLDVIRRNTAYIHDWKYYFNLMKGQEKVEGAIQFLLKKETT